jgi:hypothetical protein
MIGNGVPYMYDYINTATVQNNPNTVHCKNTYLQQYFSRYLLQKAMSVMKWNFPENWDKDYFLYSLYCWGTVAIINTDKFGVIPQACTLQGFNVFYRPLKVVITNPLLKGLKELVIDKQCVLFKMTNDYGGIMDLVNYYADQMAITAEACSMNSMNSKLSYVFSARNKAGAESLKKLLDKIMGGDIGVFYDEKLRRQHNETTEEPWSTFAQNLAQNFITPDLMDCLRRWEEMFCNEIGIPNTRSDKKERLVTSEAISTRNESKTRVEMWLESWQDCCKKVKKMFGVSISVDWRYKKKEGEIL